MKNYIRTKDGGIFAPTNAYYLKEDNSLICYVIGEDEFNYNPRTIDVNSVIKAADTIEELCDEFVWDNSLIEFTNKEKTKFLIKQANAEYEEEYDIEEDFDEDSSPIYGSIWIKETNGAPTLKPVAKMNEKGELKLL